jgi:hypothetical protein
VSATSVVAGVGWFPLRVFPFYVTSDLTVTASSQHVLAAMNSDGIYDLPNDSACAAGGQVRLTPFDAKTGFYFFTINGNVELEGTGSSRSLTGRVRNRSPHEVYSITFLVSFVENGETMFTYPTTSLRRCSTWCRPRVRSPHPYI